MRESSLKYFLGVEFFNYHGHIFDLDTKILKKYFVFLKNLDTVSIQTRKNKWHILTSFLNFTMEDYPDIQCLGELQTMYSLKTLAPYIAV